MIENERADRWYSGSDKLVLCILSVHELGLNRDMAKVMGLLFISIKDLVLVAHKLDSLLVLVLLDGLCEGRVQDLASVGRDAKIVKAVEDIGRGCGFIARGTAVVVGTNSVFIGGSGDVLLASDLGFAWDRDGAEETAFLGVTVGLTVWYSSGIVYWRECSVGNSRLSSSHRHGVLATTLGEDGAHAPLGLVVCIALVVLSSAAKVGCGRCLLRRHG